MTVTENTNNDYTYTISESTEALNAKSSNLLFCPKDTVASISKAWNDILMLIQMAV